MSRHLVQHKLLRRVVLSLPAALMLVVGNGAKADSDNAASRFLGEFFGNATYKAEASVMAYPDDPESSISDDDTVYVSPRLTISTEASLSDSVALSAEMYLAASTQEDEYDEFFRGPGEEGRQPKYIDLNTLFLSFDNDDYVVEIGKNLIETGLAEMYQPTNRFGLFDGATPPNFRKTGVWQANIDVLLDDDTVSFNVTPFHERSTLPPVKSRWLGTSGDADFENISLPDGEAGVTGTTITDKFFSTSPENFGYMLQYEGVRSGYDFFGFIHHGPSIYPVIRQIISGTANYEKIDPLATSIGGGVAAVVDAWKFYGEGIVQVTDADKDQDFFRYVLGVNYRETEFANSIGFDEIKPMLEWAGDEVIDDQSASEYVVSSRETRPFRNAVIARVEIQHNKDWGYSLGGIYNVEVNDWNLTAGAEYRPNDNLTLQLLGSVFDGTDTTHFGRWQDNDFVEVKSAYKF